MKLRRAAKALIRRKDGRYLILTSSIWEDNPARSQKPDLPGGIIEASESIEQGLNRELQEEIGLTVAADKLELVFASTHIDEAEATSTVFLLYFIQLDEPTITLSWEHESYDWMSAEQVKTLDIRQPYPRIFEHFARVGKLT